MKEKKLDALKKSHEEGFITKEEYERERKNVEEMQEEEVIRKDDHPEDKKETSLRSDKLLIIAVILILVGFAAFFGLKYFTKEQPQTIDDLHALNFKGKLKEGQGYLYKGTYSFVKFENLWYTQLVSPKGTRLYNIQFRYGPKDVESVNIKGRLNDGVFNNATEYYVTFNPRGNDFSSVAVAVGDFNQQMTRIFFKQPIAACDRNETLACLDRPIITCENTDKLVLYAKESNSSRVAYNNNCIMVEGNGLELVKGVDRVLYDLYGIMKQ